MLADLVEQQTTTTGTGSYTVSGSITGRRTFSSAFGADRTNLSYVVTDDAGNFECGYGNWSQSGGTLSREEVISSSNANAAVSWAAGTKRIYLAAHAGAEHLNARNNSAYTAGVTGYIAGYPASTHNESFGFGQGSTWFGLNRKLTCQNITGGVAEWRLDVQSEWTPIAQGGGKTVFFGCLLDGETVRHSYRGASFAAAQSNSNSTPGTSGFYMGLADTAIIPLCAMTTNATPTVMGVDALNASGDGGIIGTPGCVTLTGSVSAFDSATGDVKSWKVEAVLKCSSGYVVTVAAGSTPTVIHGDAGLSTATCAIDTGTSGDGCFSILVTGVAAKTIRWSASLLACIVGDGN